MEEARDPVAQKCREEREVPHIMQTCSPTLFVCLITFLLSLPNNTPCLVWCVWESQHVLHARRPECFPTGDPADAAHTHAGRLHQCDTQPRQKDHGCRETEDKYGGLKVYDT